MNADSRDWLITTPGTDVVLEQALRQAAHRGIGAVFIFYDLAGDDWSTEVIGEVQEDGSIVIQHINQWRSTIDADPANTRDEGAR